MRIVRYFTIAALLAAFPAMTGCGALRLKDFDRAANRDIGKLALLDVDEPEGFQIISQSGVTVLSGFVDPGIGIDQTSLTNNRAYQELHLGRQLTAALEAELTAAGYEVVHVKANRRRPSDFLGDYANIRSDADAILDVAINDGGYSQKGVGGTFVAYLYTKARMVKLPKGEIVYSDNVVIYTASGREATVSRDAIGFGQAKEVTRVEQPDVGTFISTNEVRADPARSIRAFAASSKLLAAYYGRTLAR